MTHANKLAAKIAAHNKANAEANRLHPILVAALEPFVGKKVLTHGGITKALEKALPEMPYSNGLSYYRGDTRYSLSLVVKTFEHAEHGGHYAEVSMYVGEVNGYDLVKVLPQQKPLRTDFTESEVLEKRQAYKAAKKIADDAQSALFPFGEHDNF